MRMKVTNEQDKKSQLATEIHDISNRAVACVNLHHPYTNRKPFIDWYLILNVNENAKLDVIKKQYHKLALQLHPDKNKHSKAESAFKLVSEAYSCLSNDTKRSDFDSKRNNISCIRCHTNPSVTPNSSNHTTPKPTKDSSSHSNRVQRRMNELRIKLKNEATIIDKCLAKRREITSGMRTELPVFNPSDYQSKGYPHHTKSNHKNLENLRDNGFIIGNRCMRKNDSPIFDYENRASFMSRSGSRMRT